MNQWIPVMPTFRNVYSVNINLSLVVGIIVCSLLMSTGKIQAQELEFLYLYIYI